MINWLRVLCGVRSRHDRRAQAQAVADAQRRLDEAHAQDPEIRSVVGQLKALREYNNFGPRIAAAFREHR